MAALALVSAEKTSGWRRRRKDEMAAKVMAIAGQDDRPASPPPRAIRIPAPLTIVLPPSYGRSQAVQLVAAAMVEA